MVLFQINFLAAVLQIQSANAFPSVSFKLVVILSNDVLLKTIPCSKKDLAVIVAFLQNVRFICVSWEPSIGNPHAVAKEGATYIETLSLLSLFSAKPQDSPPRTRSSPSAADKDHDWRSGSTRGENVHFTPVHNTKNKKFMSKGSFSSLNRLHHSLHSRHESDGKEKWTRRARQSALKRTSESSNSDVEVRGSKPFTGSYAEAVAKPSKLTVSVNNETSRSNDLGYPDVNNSDDEEGKDLASDNEGSFSEGKIETLGERVCVNDVIICDDTDVIADVTCVDDSKIADTSDTADKTADAESSVVTGADCSPDEDDNANDAISTPTKTKKKRGRRFKKNKRKSNAGDAIENIPDSWTGGEIKQLWFQVPSTDEAFLLLQCGRRGALQVWDRCEYDAFGDNLPPCLPLDNGIGVKGALFSDGWTLPA